MELASDVIRVAPDPEAVRRSREGKDPDAAVTTRIRN